MVSVLRPIVSSIARDAVFLVLARPRSQNIRRIARRRPATFRACAERPPMKTEPPMTFESVMSALVPPGVLTEDVKLKTRKESIL